MINKIVLPKDKGPTWHFQMTHLSKNRCNWILGDNGNIYIVLFFIVSDSNPVFRDSVIITEKEIFMHILDYNNMAVIW